MFYFIHNLNQSPPSDTRPPPSRVLSALGRSTTLHKLRIGVLQLELELGLPSIKTLDQVLQGRRDVYPRLGVLTLGTFADEDEIVLKRSMASRRRCASLLLMQGGLHVRQVVDRRFEVFDGVAFVVEEDVCSCVVKEGRGRKR